MLTKMLSGSRTKMMRINKRIQKLNLSLNLSILDMNYYKNQVKVKLKEKKSIDSQLKDLKIENKTLKNRITQLETELEEAKLRSNHNQKEVICDCNELLNYLKKDLISDQEADNEPHSSKPQGRIESRFTNLYKQLISQIRHLKRELIKVKLSKVHTGNASPESITDIQRIPKEVLQ